MDWPALRDWLIGIGGIATAVLAILKFSSEILTFLMKIRKWLASKWAFLSPLLVLLRTHPIEVLTGLITGAVLGLSAGYFIADMIVLPHQTTSLASSYDECNTRNMALLNDLDQKDRQLQGACKEDVFNKLKDDNQLLKMNIERCEKANIDRDSVLVQTQRENNALKQYREDAEARSRAHFATLDSLRAQYHKAKDGLSRCQTVVNDRTTPLFKRCDDLAKQIQENGAQWAAIPSHLEDLNRPLYKQRKELKCDQFVQCKF